MENLSKLKELYKQDCSKIFTCNTASLVQGLQDAGGEHVTVVAIVDDITITLSALVTSRNNLQKPLQTIL